MGRDDMWNNNNVGIDCIYSSNCIGEKSKASAKYTKNPRHSDNIIERSERP